MSILTAYDKFIQQALKYGFSLWGTAKTGEEIHYRGDCDGDLEKGYPKVPPRFKDNGDGTITDNATGLMWVKDPTLVRKNWNDAIDYCPALDYAGHNDWQLPNIKELISILDYSRTNPSIDTVFFPNTVNDNYFSSTTFAGDTADAWTVYFSFSTIGHILKGLLGYVRPVRLGVPKD